MKGTFSDSFRSDLRDLMRWRRDVRRFRTDPVEAAVLNRCLDAFALSPSVGLSQPWRLVQVASDGARAAAVANFMAANTEALAGYCGDKAQLYAGLKLSGMREAPVHLAVFCDEATAKGAGLGPSLLLPIGPLSKIARSAGLSRIWVRKPQPRKYAHLGRLHQIAIGVAHMIIAQQV